MDSKSEPLINPLIDISYIPPDIPRFVYDMLDIVEEVPDPTISGMDLESCAWEPGPKTTDDIWYDVIMSCFYNNDVIGW